MLYKQSDEITFCAGSAYNPYPKQHWTRWSIQGYYKKQILTDGDTH